MRCFTLPNMKNDGRIEKLDLDGDGEGLREGFAFEGEKGMKRVF